MFRRFHGNRKGGGNPSGKWQRIPHTGLGGVVREEVQGWTIELAHRKVGSAIRRDQYSVAIRREFPAHEEYLTGFSSKTSALAAARKRVDLLQSIRQRVVRRPSRAGFARDIGKRRV